MKLANKISLPATLVFAPSGKLVSFSKNLNEYLSQGMVFNDIICAEEDLLKKLINEDDSASSKIEWKITKDFISYCYHVMRDPVNNPLALIVTLIKDTSEFKKHEVDEKMVRMDRLAQVGQLAASIAHEIRNPLAGINANVQVMADMLQGEKSYSKFLDVILEEIERVEKIIKNLLNYAKIQKPVMEKISIDELYKHVETLLHTQLRKMQIKLNLKKDENLPEFFADNGQLIQIFINCIINASQAMPNGGNIIIHVEASKDKKEIYLHFIDEGTGISKDVLEKIFDPFFTTRAKGLGLGLSVVRKIIDDHEGKIFIESEETKGTKLSISLPLKE